jgi:hypothetical protein
MSRRTASLHQGQVYRLAETPRKPSDVYSTDLATITNVCLGQDDALCVRTAQRMSWQSGTKANSPTWSLRSISTQTRRSLVHKARKSNASRLKAANGAMSNSCGAHGGRTLSRVAKVCHLRVLRLMPGIARRLTSGASTPARRIEMVWPFRPDGAANSRRSGRSSRCRTLCLDGRSPCPARKWRVKDTNAVRVADLQAQSRQSRSGA